MPYIKQKDRERVLGGIGICKPDLPDPKTAGELNYIFTCLVDNYLKEQLNYQRINDCIGALEGAKLELYRRVVIPYENKKIEENGDVYSTELL